MHRWVEHTSEVELEIEAADEPGVLGDALKALTELLGCRADGADEVRELAVQAADRPALLAGWLEELVFLAESEGFVARSLDHVQISEHELLARVSGTRCDPSPLVKAVTYHRLAFEPRGRGYFARVILDV